MTEPQVPLDPGVARAVDRAVAAGLVSVAPGDHRWWGEVRCPDCDLSLTYPAQPWSSEQTVRRVDGFTLRHRDHAATVSAGED